MKLNIHTPDHIYPIVFYNSFDSLQETFKEIGLPLQKLCIITDTNVDLLYGDEVKQALESFCKKVVKYTIKAGEGSKHLQTVEDIYSFCIEHQFDRQSTIVALGGGVVGDIAGFVAATYMRGINFVQIPTTLLAQNDSSVGGKVGVDFQNHKNMIGAFYQPKIVYMNTKVLSTLPTREFAAGMAEIIKHGLIRDKEFYNFIIENSQLINAINHEKITQMNFTSCKIKGDVVGQDEKETSLRKILNFGHTIGHAIETLSNFEYLHGECVSLGIVAAAHISLQRNMISDNDFQDIQTTLKLYNLPIGLKDLNSDDIYAQLFYDKKVSDSKVVFILLTGIGECIEVNDVTKDEVLKSIEYLKKMETSRCI